MIIPLLIIITPYISPMFQSPPANQPWSFLGNPGDPDRQAPAESAHDGGHRLAIGWPQQWRRFFWDPRYGDVERKS